MLNPNVFLPVWSFAFCFSLAFWKTLAVAFAFSVVGSKARHPRYSRLHLFCWCCLIDCFNSCTHSMRIFFGVSWVVGCCAHFRPISCAIGWPFTNIRTSHVALLFNPKSSPICFCSQCKAHTSSPSSLLHFCRCSSFILLLSSLPISGLYRCFADKAGFAPAAPTFELCSSTRHFAFVRPMFSDLSLRITHLVGMLSLTGSLFCLDSYLSMSMLISSWCTFSRLLFRFGLVIAVVGIAMNSVLVS